ncbi:MAG TPA: hypothetical protein PLN18_02865 [Candidatus Colwellbacteria bacterium]|mgnify:CR=1 FL=1|nr:hypothetical protein [Candidatus Colwellbacteria bacterium]HQA96283.1 hypothetical protein [Candidatus Colwellbacteria bacterium]
MRKPLILTCILLIIAAVFYFAYQKNLEPIIILIYPNGGETIKKGSIETIKWKTKGIPEDYKIALSIRRITDDQIEGQEFDPIIFTDLPNTGNAEWPVSDSYPDGDYILGINVYASTPIINPIYDESDSVFRITE